MDGSGRPAARRAPDEDAMERRIGDLTARLEAEEAAIGSLRFGRASRDAGPDVGDRHARIEDLRRSRREAGGELEQARADRRKRERAAAQRRQTRLWSKRMDALGEIETLAAGLRDRILEANRLAAAIVKDGGGRPLADALREADFRARLTTYLGSVLRRPDEERAWLAVPLVDFEQRPFSSGGPASLTERERRHVAHCLAPCTKGDES